MKKFQLIHKFTNTLLLKSHLFPITQSSSLLTISGYDSRATTQQTDSKPPKKKHTSPSFRTVEPQSTFSIYTYAVKVTSTILHYSPLSLMCHFTEGYCESCKFNIYLILQNSGHDVPISGLAKLQRKGVTSLQEETSTHFDTTR